jgi:hypothetical protein
VLRHDWDGRLQRITLAVNVGGQNSANPATDVMILKIFSQFFLRKNWRF